MSQPISPRGNTDQSINGNVVNMSIIINGNTGNITSIDGNADITPTEKKNETNFL